jgi:hypothetical protein
MGPVQNRCFLLLLEIQIQIEIEHYRIWQMTTVQDTESGLFRCYVPDQVQANRRFNQKNRFRFR